MGSVLVLMMDVKMLLNMLMRLFNFAFPLRCGAMGSYETQAAAAFYFATSISFCLLPMPDLPEKVTSCVQTVSETFPSLDDPDQDDISSRASEADHMPLALPFWN